MPITKSAIKKLRSDKKKAIRNKMVKTKVKNVVDTFKASLNLTSLSSAFSALDRAAKKGIIKTSKADRLKSRLSKRVK